MSTRPGFFRVFIPHEDSEIMKLPSAFASHVKEGMVDIVLLRNSHGKSWTVEVTRVENNLFFRGNGWVSFVAYSALKFGDVLICDYNGSSIVDVMLMDAETFCEKELKVFPHPKMKEKEGEEEESDDEEYKKEEEEDDSSDEGDAENAEDREEKEEMEENEKSAKHSKTTNGGTKSGAIISGVQGDEDIFQHGVVPRPKNPYFVAKFKASRKNELFVPTEVIKAFNLKFREKLIVLDHKGKKWETKVKLWKDGRTWLAGGWKSFCKWHNLKWEDRCIGEFVGRGPLGLHLKIHILRAGSWLPKKEGPTMRDQAAK